MPTTVIVEADLSDGFVRSPQDVWATAHDAAVGAVVEDAFHADDHAMSVYGDMGKYIIGRSFFSFDTSLLPDNCVVLSATLRIYGIAEESSNVVAQLGLQGDPLTVNDYNAFAGGGKLRGAAGREYGHTEVWHIGEWNEIPLNATGIKDINREGRTRVCCRQYAYDYLDIEPPFEPAYLYNGCTYADDPAGRAPQLVIEYYVPKVCRPTTREAHYIVRTYNHQGQRLNHLEHFELLEYTKTVKGQCSHQWGLYTAQFAADSIEPEHFGLDYIVEISRRPPGGAMAVDFEGWHRTPRFFYDADDLEHFVSAGPDLDALLQRPVILPDADSGFFARTDHHDDIMRELVRYQMSGLASDPLRRYPGLTVESDQHQGISLLRAVRRIKLFTELETLSDLGSDFGLRREGTTLTFWVQTPRGGVDRRAGTSEAVVFSLRNRNMVHPVWEYDRSGEVNVVYVLGDGITASRMWVERGSLTNAQFDSPYNRIEEVAEAHQQASPAALMALGDGLLAERQAHPTLTFEAGFPEGCLYESHWDLGDLVTGQYRGVDHTFRIVAVTIRATAVGQTVVPTLWHVPDVYLET